MTLLTENALFTIISVLWAVVFTFVAIYLYFKYCYTYWKQLGIPYLEPSFPLGNFEDPFNRTKSTGVVLAEYYNEMKAKGHKYFGIFMFQNPVLIVVDPNIIKSVMSRDFGYFYDRGVYHDEENDPLSASIFALEGQKWKNLRAKLTPTFTSGKLKKMFSTLVDCSLELKDCLNEPIQKGEPIDIKKISAQYTTDVIGSCAFGIECNSFKNPHSDFIEYGKRIFSPTGLDKLKMFMTFINPKIMKMLKMRIINKEVDFFYRNLVKDTIEYREKNNVTRNDFMQLLIQLKNKGVVEYEEHDEDELQDNNENKEVDFKFTLNSLSAQAFLFFVAGFETSSTTMTWTLFELSINPEIQNKLRSEIVRVLKKHDGKITYDALMEMHYMERVIKGDLTHFLNNSSESLRKYPPLMLLQRVVTSDYSIPDTNVVLKKGTRVFIPNYGIQRDPEYYPDPEKFDPDRFLEENKSTRPDYTWLPFGEGPRVCIGMRFGMMQTKVGLTQLLLNYKFTLNEKTENPPVLNPYVFVATAKDAIFLNAERV